MLKQELWEKLKRFNPNKLIITFSLILFMLLLWSNYRRGERIKVIETLNTSLNDTVTFWRTKEGLSKARITVLESYNTSDFIELTTKDTTVKKLQKLVEKNKKYINKQGSITIIESETTIDTTTPTVVDNNTKKDSTGNSPVYRSKINLGKWVTGIIVASKDSTTTKLSIKNEMDLVIGREKTGFLGLGKGKTFVEATLHNPYSEVKVLRTYQTQLPKTKKIHVGPTLMYGIGQNFSPGVYVGVGVTWGIINF
jgi:hypothetical protein